MSRKCFDRVGFGSMVVKEHLRAVFEQIVKSPCASVDSPVGKLSVLTWLISLDEKTRKIHLYAVTRLGLVSKMSSYPFGSVKNAYQFMVRL